MLTTALAVGVLSVMGFYLIFVKLPKRVKRFMMNHPLFTDLTAALATYALFAGTITGLIAAAWVGIMVSIMLALVNNPVTSEVMQRLAKKIDTLKENFISWLAKQNPEQKKQMEKTINLKAI